MKNVKSLFIAACLIYTFSACEEPQEMIMEDNPSGLSFNDKASQPAEIPFKAKLHTSQAEDALSIICSVNSPTDFWAMEHQVGGGQGTHLGNFTVDLTFCFHIVLDGEGFPDLEGGFGEYDGSDGLEAPIIMAANGDLLYAEVLEESSLVPVQNETYDFEFDDVWYIIGGTGRFENASGEFNGHGKVRSDGTGTDHVWEGTLILPNASSNQD
ncbi:hypothetical protein GZ212_05500 [Mangrovimonas sp. CR14]|uniref:hypothetical protein n=1 Tax=Mangrovimonas sp. CR14 TaxID=2706120 RepID=UPI00141F4024|nr:hypothetical protein [Mangrovimonas sp. CR14]NIK91600.1 hypothetical protein [Mangrovimonas sp. CR14]